MNHVSDGPTRWCGGRQFSRCACGSTPAFGRAEPTRPQRARTDGAPGKRKHTALKKYQFPESEESVGRSNYYTKALSGIKQHHRGDHDFVEGRGWGTRHLASP